MVVFFSFFFFLHRLESTENRLCIFVVEYLHLYVGRLSLFCRAKRQKRVINHSEECPLGSGLSLVCERKYFKELVQD